MSVIAPVAPPLVPSHHNQSGRVDPRQHVAEGTQIRVIGALIVLGFVTLLFALITWGVSLVLTGVGFLILWFRLAKSRAAIRASALRVGPQQFPEVHEAVVDLSSRLGLPSLPEVYIVDAGLPNALAMRLGSTTYVLLYSQVVHGALRLEEPRIIRWILAHELAHHALGHTGLLRGRLRAMLPSLSRRDEFSCDAVAHALIGDELVGRHALGLLMVGSHLYEQIDQAALDAQVQEAVIDKSTRKAENSFRMTHPLLLRRIARLRSPIKI